MRKADYCIRNIGKLVSEGCISPERAKDLEKWQMFREKHPEISGLSEGACKPLMREKDTEVQANAIKKIENALNLKKPVTATQTTRVVKNIEEGKDSRGRPLETSNDTEIPKQPTPKEDIDENVEIVVEDFVDPEKDDVGGVPDIPNMPDQPIVEVVGTGEGIELAEIVEEEEVVVEEDVIRPEITAKVTREFLLNAGHEAPFFPKPKGMPSEEDKQGIFEKCITQAFEWEMDGDEIARRMEKAIMFVFPSRLRNGN